jgi:lipopolysaccharide export system protein LptA
MSADQNSSVVTFTGRVIARQDDLIITCDTMLVHYQQDASQPKAPPEPSAEGPSIPPPPPSAKPAQSAAAAPEAGAGAPAAQPEGSERPPAASGTGDPFGGKQEIYRVDCEGSVRIQQRDKLAVGQKALYLARSEPRRLILTGDARIWEGANSVTGHQVVYYLDQNRSQVESRANQRVRAFYDQGGAGE